MPETTLSQTTFSSSALQGKVAVVASDAARMVSGSCYEVTAGDSARNTA